MKKLALAALFSLGLAQQAHAISVTYDFGGSISTILGSPGSIMVGDAFTGSFTYDVPGPADSDPDSTVGQYLSTGGLNQLSAAIGGGNTFGTNAATASEKLRVYDQGAVVDGFTYDEFGVTTNTGLQTRPSSSPCSFMTAPDWPSPIHRYRQCSTLGKFNQLHFAVAPIAIKQAAP